MILYKRPITRRISCGPLPEFSESLAESVWDIENRAKKYG
jgi:hypothetical protein